MTKGARTLYYDKNLILVTTEGAKNVSVDEQLFDFSYSLEPKKFLGSSAVRTKFAELYKAEQDKEKRRFFSHKTLCHHVRHKGPQPYQLLSLPTLRDNEHEATLSRIVKSYL